MESTGKWRGLSDSEVERSRAEHGSNSLTVPPKTPLWMQWLEKFQDPTIIILCVCAGIAIVLGLVKGEIPWDGVAILVAVALATAGGTWSEYKADKAFETLKRDSDNVPVKSIRNGVFHTIASPQVVVGDIVLLEGGDRVPADGVLEDGVEPLFDESLMTGESAAVAKKKGERALGGTHLLTGSAVVRIDKVGDATELGVLASALGRPWRCPDEAHGKRYRAAGKCDVCGKELEQESEPPTPLQKRLAGLADSISVWGTVAAVFIFVALIGCAIFADVHGSATWGRDLLSARIWPLWIFALLGIAGLKILSLEKKAKWMVAWLAAIAAACGVAWSFGSDALLSVQRVMQFFMVAVTIIVVAVPEGLPLAIFIALGLGMRKIREDNNLVRKMMATETIGSATVICSDKTGTLTRNRMSVGEACFADGDLAGEKALVPLGCAVNSTAELEEGAEGLRPSGNPTEAALLEWLRGRKMDYAAIRAGHPVIDRRVFSADRKFMSTLTDAGGKRVLLVKGAPERVFERCAGGPVSECARRVGELAAEGVRTLALAYRFLPAGTKAITDDDERGLTLLGIFGLADPVREDVPEAVRRCGAAGIEVKMVTGDHPLTAHSIAAKIGMLKKGDIEMTGEEFSKTPDDELLGKMERIRVIARAKPVNKVRLVELLQRKGAVVAMTGDGTNDAPALKKADVGISMGLRGTDVAKQASDIVLTDDNFGSIIKAVHWGRTLYENLQKFVQFQLTVNLSALGIAFVSPIVATLFPGVGFEVQPLTVLQYLWINLIMDTLAAIAFGLEPPRDSTLTVAPKRASDAFLTRTMLWNICVMGGYFILLILAVEAFDLLGLEAYKGTVPAGKFELMKASVVFNCYVWFQIFHMFNARAVQPGESVFSGLSKSRSFFIVMGFVAVMQFALVQFGGVALHTAALPLAIWLRILALGATAVLAGEILRRVQKSALRRQCVKE